MSFAGQHPPSRASSSRTAHRSGRQAGKARPYPWRFATEPELVLPDERQLPAGASDRRPGAHRKWSREHWTLAFQGQLRPISERDAGCWSPHRGADRGGRMTDVTQPQPTANADEHAAGLQQARRGRLAHALPRAEARRPGGSEPERLDAAALVRQDLPPTGGRTLVHESVSAFGAFTWVEAAVLPRRVRGPRYCCTRARKSAASTCPAATAP